MRDFLESVEKGFEGDEVYNPLKAAQKAMLRPLPKRFYKTVEVAEMNQSFGILLDGKQLKTPAKKALELPVLQAAQLVADEWEAVETEIDPAKMPFSRLVNTAIDAVASKHQEVFEDIVSFAANDLICYRADAPEGLVAKQNAKWDPLIDWVRAEFEVNLVLAEGIVHQSQPDDAISNYKQALSKHGSYFQLSCLHTLTTISGSAVVALAVAEGKLDTNQAWDSAHVDEDWNIAQWGEDYEASVRRKIRYEEFEAACKLLSAVS